jgi:1-acyl-sn-glycerol-3-phosphate acyltransferase
MYYRTEGQKSYSVIRMATRRPNSPVIYFLLHRFGRFAWFCTMNARIIGKENLDRPGAYLLVSNHCSHVDPLVLSTLHPRPVDWMTRIEFFRIPPLAWLIRRLGGFVVNRQGVPVSAIRTAMARLASSRIVGIFPEGGVTAGSESVCRGAAIKHGVCLIACRSGVPIIPCVIIGSHKLSRIGPWLPFRRARIWMAIGEPIWPPTDITNRKAARTAMGHELQKRFVRLYEQTVREFGIEPADRA